MESTKNPNLRPGQVAFYEFVFDTDSGDLRKGAECTRLSRQPALVLRLLTEHAGEVVTRAEIRDALWGTGTHVDFEQGINWCVLEIRKALGDDASQPRFVETIAKRGYRFLPSCSCVPVVNALARSTPLSMFSGKGTAGVAGFLGLLLMVSFVMLSAHKRPPTVLVLPLDNFTGDAGLDHLADARTDYIIATLGVHPAELRVIDRPTAYKFKNTGDCIIHIGKQLHADYVLVGSIDPTGQGPRLSGGVFRVADNTQVWSRADIDPLNDFAMSELPKAISATLR